MGEKCYFCDSTDTKPCGECGHSFCDRCRIRYDKRIVAMIKEKWKKLGFEWLTRKEYDERKENEK